MDADAPIDDSAPMRTAKACGPDASVVGVKSAVKTPADDGVKKARSPGRARYKR